MVNVKRLIYIDFDGVICDSAFLRKEWLRSGGYNVDSEPLDTGSEIRKVFGTHVHRLVKSNTGYSDTLSAPEITGAKKGLCELSECYDIKILTARDIDKGRWVLAWLAKMGMTPFVSGVVHSEKRAKVEICLEDRAYGLIDNDLANLVGCEASGELFKVLLNDYDGDVPSAINVCSRWSDIVDLLL